MHITSFWMLSDNLGIKVTCLQEFHFQNWIWILIMIQFPICIEYWIWSTKPISNLFMKIESKMDQTYPTQWLFNIQYNLDLWNKKLEFKINIQCILKAIITKSCHYQLAMHRVWTKHTQAVQNWKSGNESQFNFQFGCILSIWSTKWTSNLPGVLLRIESSMDQTYLWEYSKSNIIWIQKITKCTSKLIFNVCWRP